MNILAAYATIHATLLALTTDSSKESLVIESRPCTLDTSKRYFCASLRQPGAAAAHVSGIGSTVEEAICALGHQIEREMGEKA